MNPQLEWEPERREPDFRRWWSVPVLLAGAAAVMVVILYQMCKIEVDTGQQAVLIRKAGLDLEPRHGARAAAEGRASTTTRGCRPTGPTTAS